VQPNPKIRKRQVKRKEHCRRADERQQQSAGYAHSALLAIENVSPIAADAPPVQRDERGPCTDEDAAGEKQNREAASFRIEPASLGGPDRHRCADQHGRIDRDRKAADRNAAPSEEDGPHRSEHRQCNKPDAADDRNIGQIEDCERADRDEIDDRPPPLQIAEIAADAARDHAHADTRQWVPRKRQLEHGRPKPQPRRAAIAKAARTPASRPASRCGSRNSEYGRTRSKPPASAEAHAICSIGQERKQTAPAKQAVRRLSGMSFGSIGRSRTDAQP
jgi:hypothetical protein